MLRKIISLTLTLSFLLQQTVFAYTTSLNLSAYLNQGPNLTVSDRFRPVSLRYFSYQPLTNDFKVLLDKGDYAKSSGHQDTKSPEKEDSVLKEAAKELMDYFKIGLSLPNDKFWVNLRPDSEDEIIDEELAKTDLGKVMLEADLKLKQDTSLFTSPQTPQGKEYWNRLYKKAGELFGTENITIPTLTRPWIVPGEIILRESNDKSSQGAYIYKANLKVMLEEDYLKSSQLSAISSQQYEFNDPRLKELNQYSTQLIRELILPKLTQKVNSSKDYANLRQVYFSLILARWFKETFNSQPTVNSSENNDSYIKLIDSNNLTNLTSKQAWDKTTYFNAYQKSFQEGEYNLSEPIYTPTGQVIRRYMSGGMFLTKTNPGKYTREGNIVASPSENMVLLKGGSFMEQTTGSPLLEEKKDELGIILDGMNSKLTKAQFLVGNYFEDAKKMIASKQDLAGLRKSVYEVISELGELSQDKAEVIKSGMEKLREFYAYLNADMFAEKLREASPSLTKKLIKNAISGGRLILNPVSFAGLPTDAFTKDKYYLLPASLSIEGANYRIKVIAGERKDYIKELNQNKYMILELVPEDDWNTLLPLIELRVYDVDPLTEKYEIKPIIHYGGHKAPKKKDSQEEPFYKERLRGLFNELFNSEPQEADKYQSALAIQLIMRACSASVIAGSALEVKDRLEGINNLLKQYKNTENVKHISVAISGYLRDLEDNEKSLSALRESLDKITTNIKEFLLSEDGRDPNVVSVDSKIMALKLLRESLTPEGIILEAFKEQWPFLERLLSTTPSYLEFEIEDGLRIGNNISCSWVKSVINPRHIEVYIYRNKSSLSEALRISVYKGDKYNPVTVQINDSSVKLAMDNMSIPQSQDLSKDIISMVILSGYKDKASAEDVLTIGNAIKNGDVLLAAERLRKIVILGVKNHSDIFNYMELAQIDENFYSSKDYYKEALGGISNKLEADLALDVNDLVGVAEKLAGAAEQAGYMYLYAFAKNISEDLKNLNERSVDPSTETADNESAASVLIMKEEIVFISSLVSNFYGDIDKLYQSTPEHIKHDLAVNGWNAPELLIKTISDFKDLFKEKKDSIMAPQELVMFLKKELALKMNELEEKHERSLQELEFLSRRISEDGRGEVFSEHYSSSNEHYKTLINNLKEYAKITNKFTEEMGKEMKKLRSSSALSQRNSLSKTGGIDFRSMNMLVQPAGSFAGLDYSLPALSKAEIESFDLNEELAAIRDMVKAGMAPSGQRLKEYLVVCFEKGETKDKIDSLILCLADIFELQQFEAGEASPEYKEALVIADTRRYTIKEDRFAASEKNSYSLN